MRFENGYTVSVQFGPDNYCEKRVVSGNVEPSREHAWTSPDAEIAVFDPEGKFVNLGSDDVQGWCCADTVGKVIAIVQVGGGRDWVRNRLLALL